MTIGDLNLSWLEFGEGEQPLILLHGGWFWAEGNWSVHFKALNPHFRVYAPDNRGHGHTNLPDGSFESYHEMASDLIGFVDALNLERKPLVMGHSEGAILALHASIRKPELFERQILIGIHPFTGASERHRRGMEQFFGVSDYRYPPDKWQYFLRSPLRAMALKVAHRKVNWHRLIVAIWDLWNTPFNLEKKDYARISCPTLVVFGRDEEFGSKEEFVELSNWINEGREGEPMSVSYQITPEKGKRKADHMFVTESPEALREVALPFLRFGEWPGKKG